MEISINQQAPIQAKSNCLILPMGKQPDWDKLAQALIITRYLSATRF